MGNRKDCTALTVCTPGPWHTRAGMSGVQIFNDAGACIARTPCFDRQAQADGALLAAAPELLNALQSVASALEWHEDRMPKGQDSGALDLARAAIAKAEGRS